MIYMDGKVNNAPSQKVELSEETLLALAKMMGQHIQPGQPGARSTTNEGHDGYEAEYNHETLGKLAKAMGKPQDDVAEKNFSELGKKQEVKPTNNTQSTIDILKDLSTTSGLKPRGL